MTINHRRFTLLGVGGLLSAVLLFPSVARAFQSMKTQAVVAGFYPSEPSPELPLANLTIRHAPPSQYSAVTREIILIGEVGQELFPTSPPYNRRLTPDSDFGPLPSRKIRVRLLYRAVSNTFFGQGVGAFEISTGPITELSVIEGPDPLAFAFAIPKSSVATEIIQYRILAETLQFDAGVSCFTVTGRVAFPSTVSAEPEAFQTIGAQSNASDVFEPSGGKFVLFDANPLDGETTLEIPPGVLSGPTNITMNELPLDSPLIPGGLVDPISVYHLFADGPVRGFMQLSLLYPDFEFPSGQDGLIDSNTSISESRTDIALWDGFLWRRLGARGNISLNTLSVKVKGLNFMAVVPAAALSAEDRRPMEKIITPNGDGQNDEALFTLGGTGRVEIFDTTGHRIRTIYGASNDRWDGRDDDGKIVESGVYIYQYEADGTRVSGLIAVAK